MKCENPFFKCEGKSNKIAVMIRLKGKEYEVCDSCWEKIADSDIEWVNTREDPDLKARDLRLWATE
jgi:hypothetical protein